MDSCLFCKIIHKEIPADILYEDDDFLVFKDIYPKANIHLLMIPKRHIDSFNTLTAADEALMGKLTVKLKDIAAKNGLEAGFRTIINTGSGGGQEVYHIHYHLLGGGNLGKM